METLLLNDFDLEDNYYQRVYEDMMFYHEFVQQELEMERYINEHIILASGNQKAINEMTILNEAGFGEKVKAFFEKIKNFFRAIFAKFTERLDDWIGDVKKYCDKYSNIINTRKFIAGDVVMYNHFKGYENIVKAVSNNTIPTQIDLLTTNPDNNNEPLDLLADAQFKKLHDALTSNDANKIIAFRDENTKNNTLKFSKEAQNKYSENKLTQIAQGFDKSIEIEKDDNGVVDANKTFLNFFRGSKDEQDFTVDDIEKNFKYIVSTVYGSKEYLTKLQSIEKNYSTKLEQVEKKFESGYDNLKKAIDTSISKSKEEKIGASIKTATKNTKAATNKYDKEKREEEMNAAPSVPKLQPDKKETKGTSESVNNIYDLTRNNLSYYHEMEIKTGNTSSNNLSSPTNNGSSFAKSDATVMNQANDASKKATSVNTDIKTQNDSKYATQRMANVGNDENETELKDVANSLLTAAQNNAMEKIRIVTGILNTVTNSMVKGFESTITDYYAIIRAHVKSYLNENNGNNTTDNTVNRSKNTASLANGAPISTPYTGKKESPPKYLEYDGLTIKLTYDENNKWTEYSAYDKNKKRVTLDKPRYDEMYNAIKSELENRGFDQSKST